MIDGTGEWVQYNMDNVLEIQGACECNGQYLAFARIRHPQHRGRYYYKVCVFDIKAGGYRNMEGNLYFNHQLSKVKTPVSFSCFVFVEEVLTDILAVYGYFRSCWMGDRRKRNRKSKTCNIPILPSEIVGLIEGFCKGDDYVHVIDKHNGVHWKGSQKDIFFGLNP